MPKATADEAALDRMAINWLLSSDEPGIRLQARRDLLGEKVEWTAEDILEGRHAASLLRGQRADGGFGNHPYQKWMGAHWRLVSLVELGVSASEPRVMAALETSLNRFASDGDPADALRIRDRYRVHGSIYANALAVATRLGKHGDGRVRELAEWLIFWQWADGGWNCDRHPRVTHSSFYESITPLWALSEFAKATGNAAAARAAARTAEFFLAHRVFKSHSADHVGDPKWLQLRYPEYWHYDYLHGLVMLDRAGALPDPRADDAVELLRNHQQPDGRWVPSGPEYWKGRSGLYGDAAGWTRETVSQMLTLNALRVLRSVGQ